jgi:hypothetical protein
MIDPDHPELSIVRQCELVGHLGWNVPFMMAALAA